MQTYRKNKRTVLCRPARLVAALIGSVSASLAAAQSVYVDFDIMLGGSQVGAGAPSSSFPGPAGIPGLYNQVPTGNGGPWNLTNADGSNTGVYMTWTGSGGGIGYNNTQLHGDYKLFMADADGVGGPGMTVNIFGLRQGTYLVYTAACAPQGEYWETDITVPGSLEGTEAVTGPMPDNVFILGVTHSRHTLRLDGDITLAISAAVHWPSSYINGFQIVAVPEPNTLCAFVLPLGAMVLRRRRRM